MVRRKKKLLNGSTLGKGMNKGAQRPSPGNYLSDRNNLGKEQGVYIIKKF